VGRTVAEREGRWRRGKDAGGEDGGGASSEIRSWNKSEITSELFIILLNYY
jgi:hypothetical protein